MRIEWLRRVLKNLDAEAAYLAERNLQAASRFVPARLDLASHSTAGREGRVPGVREWAMSDHPYLVPYRIRDGRLQVLRIFHTRRLPPARW